MQDSPKRNFKKVKLLALLSLISIFPVLAQEKTDSITIIVNGLGRPVNSTFSDFGPIISADGLTMIFTSRRPVTENEIKKNKESKENIYLTVHDKTTGKWSEPKILSTSINKPGRYNSAIALSSDGQTMLLYRDDINGNGDIYESHFEGDNWSEAVKLPAPINSRYLELSGSISPDEQTIYFCSNRKESIGGSDIWFSIKDNNGKWGNAENLGSVINTKENEEAVFIHPDGKTLYFSSKGHNSIGGYDIFKSTFENGKWTSPVSISWLNTTDDDIYFVMAADGKTGYYSSAKAGGIGEKDIYQVRFIIDTIPKRTSTKSFITDDSVLVTGNVVNESNVPLNAIIELVDNVTGKVIIKTTTDKGKFSAKLQADKNYGIAVASDGYLFQSLNLDIPSNSKSFSLGSIVLKKIEKGKNIVLNNIFFDFDRASLRPDSKPELERLIKILNDNPTMRIEVSGHTDNRGSAIYNLKLSEARAKSVVDYLGNNGIDPLRLTYKGYGFLKPIATNETEEGRQINRRTEFKIISIGSSQETSSIQKNQENSKIISPNVKPKLPAEFIVVDKNNDGKISASEIAFIIEGFFEGTNNFTNEKLISLIDYSFEQ